MSTSIILPFNRLRYVGEGGQAIADFNGDGRLDLIFSGASRAWQIDGIDRNTKRTLVTYVYRNATPQPIRPATRRFA